jgi:LysM repeat protein
VPAFRAFSTPRELSRTNGLGRLGAAIAGREIQAALVGVMVIALVAVLVVRFSGGNAGGVASATSSPRASAAPATLRPAATVQPSRAPAVAGATTAPTPARTPKPSVVTAQSTAAAQPTPKPTKTLAATRTYRVKSGDTLSGIAAKYHTTVTALMKLNNITDPRKLRVGQVLKIP